jgi:hypothetical protein
MTRPGLDPADEERLVGPRNSAALLDPEGRGKKESPVDRPRAVRNHDRHLDARGPEDGEWVDPSASTAARRTGKGARPPGRARNPTEYAMRGLGVAIVAAQGGREQSPRKGRSFGRFRRNFGVLCGH